MSDKSLLTLILSSVVSVCFGGPGLDPGSEQIASAAQFHGEGVVVPSPTNAVRFRLYTNASPDSPHLFNTFDLEAYGENLLRSPGGNDLKRWLGMGSSSVSLHSVLVNGEGPELASTNGMIVVEQASGPDWRYVALDATAAYRGRLEQFRRGILFVEPELFVLYDHLVAKEAVSFQMILHPAAAARVDPVWHDLRLNLPRAGFRIHTPGTRHSPRGWESTESPADKFLSDTVTMRLSPAVKLAQLDVLTVFAVYRGGETNDYAFKLLESNSAVGARIHRGGLPTLVAFKTDLSSTNASVTGFGFTGPVGVSVFRPKKKVP